MRDEGLLKRGVRLFLVFLGIGFWCSGMLTVWADVAARCWSWELPCIYYPDSLALSDSPADVPDYPRPAQRAP